MSPMDSGGSENSSSSSSSSFLSSECWNSFADSSRVGLSSTSAGVSCAGFSSAIEESPGRSGGGVPLSVRILVGSRGGLSRRSSPRSTVAGRRNHDRGQSIALCAGDLHTQQSMTSGQ